MRITDVRLIPGCAAWLSEPTALVQVELDTPAAADAEIGSRMAAVIGRLCPEQPLFRVSDPDWPAAFLVAGGNGDAGPDGHRGQWLVALTVALQRWARRPVWHGAVIGSELNRLRLAIPWRSETVFRTALEFAVRLVAGMSATGTDHDNLEKLIAEVREFIFSSLGDGMSPNMLRYIQAARERDIPFDPGPNLVQLGWGAGSDRMMDSRSNDTGFIGVMTANNKFASNRAMVEAGMPLPRGEVLADADAALRLAEDVGWPVVVKPMALGQGIGVVPGITDAPSLRRAFDDAARLSPGRVIVEKHHDGDDHRLLVVNGRFVACARRIRGGVRGDGVHTVRELIDEVNAHPMRVSEVDGMLKTLVIDDECARCLANQGLDPDSIPEDGRWVTVRLTANISTGGTSEDLTAQVHPDNRRLAERAASIIALNIAGLDLLTNDISRSWRDSGAVICEINAQPGLRVHWLADPERDINGEVIDILFTARRARIPTAAVAGPRGAGAAALVLHHIWRTAGRVAGVCTRELIRIGDDIAAPARPHGQPVGRILLADPGVEAAIIESAHEDLARFGHPCDRYDVAALLDVGDDEPANAVLAEVLERAAVATVVNADDPLCMRLRARSRADRQILVTRNVTAREVVRHRAGGGEVVFVAERDGEAWIMLAIGDTEEALLALRGIDGASAAFAAAMAWAQGIGTTIIRSALASPPAPDTGRPRVVQVEP